MPGAMIVLSAILAQSLMMAKRPFYTASRLQRDIHTVNETKVPTITQLRPISTRFPMLAASTTVPCPM